MRDATLNVLFVCSRNQWRSPTAESLYADQQGMHVRSRGTSRAAKRRLTAADLEWADIVIAMENKHLSRMRSEFPHASRAVEMFCADIPDDYQYMDPELQQLIRASVSRILDDGQSTDA